MLQVLDRLRRLVSFSPAPEADQRSSPAPFDGDRMADRRPVLQHETTSGVGARQGGAADFRLRQKMKVDADPLPFAPSDRYDEMIRRFEEAGPEDFDVINADKLRGQCEELESRCIEPSLHREELEMLIGRKGAEYDDYVAALQSGSTS